jgi:RimJ/RimL family protein N-acetyltransferase
MPTILPNAQNPDIDKFAILLKPITANPEPWTHPDGRPKMIGLVGTNRWSAQGMETGYFLNMRYWGEGYAGEAFEGFLRLFWREAGVLLISLSFSESVSGPLALFLIPIFSLF